MPAQPRSYRLGVPLLLRRLQSSMNRVDNADLYH